MFPVDSLEAVPPVIALTAFETKAEQNMVIAELRSAEWF